MKSIIYLPGLGYSYFNISGHDYAERYMSSLDKMNPDRTKKYYLEKKEFQYGFENRFSTPVTCIFEYCNSKDESVEVCKIYECFYVDSLTEKFKKRNMLYKLVLILLILFTKIWTLVRAIAQKQFLNGKKRLQIFYFFTFLCLIAVFAVLMFPAMLTSFMGALNQLFDDDSILLDQILDNMASWVTFSYWVTTAMAFLATVVPEFRNFISNIATEFLCIDSYLTMGNSKLDIIGKLESLVERVSEEDDYDGLEVHGYGFGCIVLIDSIFPFGNRPKYRLNSEITNIVTIGCPHDFISTYYPDYFKNRCIPEKMALKQWSNIYSEVDILSSNFRMDNDDHGGHFKLSDKSVSIKNILFDVINVEKLGFWNHLGLIGLKAHQMFWGKGTDSSNCLSLLMENELQQETT